MPENKTLKRFEKIKKIGEGTYGTVIKVLDTKSNTFVALKKIRFQDDQQSNRVTSLAIPIYALRQISTLKELQHPNIIRVLDIKYEIKKKKLTIAFEYVQQTLEDYLRRLGVLSPFAVKVKISLNQNIIFQLLTVLKFLETRGYMHRDIKPQNLMIKNDGKLKLIDFGQMKKIPLQNLNKEKQTLQVSTLWYKAPELLLGNEFYTNKIQVWAVGCILAQISLGKPIFSSGTEIEQIFQIFKLRGTPNVKDNKKMRNWHFMNPSLPKFKEKDILVPLIGISGNNLLNKMMTIDPEHRITLTEALDHPFFEGLK